MYSRKFKLIYLPIPKNANSFLKAVFLSNHENARDFSPDKETALQYMNRTKRKKFFSNDWGLIRNQSYSKLVVIRDPAKRLVSGYLDKFAKTERDEVWCDKFCDSISKTLQIRISMDNLTFEHFCQYLFKTPDGKRDRHFKSQLSFMNGVLFDIYGDVDEMPKVLGFLESIGMNTKLPAERNPHIDKKTKYSNWFNEAHPKNIPLSQLYLSGEFPRHYQFFDNSLLNLFLVNYQDDVSLYLSVKNKSKDEYIRSFG
jgi:hypothetical protein